MEFNNSLKKKRKIKLVNINTAHPLCKRKILLTLLGISTKYGRAHEKFKAIKRTIIINCNFNQKKKKYKHIKMNIKRKVLNVLISNSVSSM